MPLRLKKDNSLALAAGEIVALTGEKALSGRH